MYIDKKKLIAKKQILNKYSGASDPKYIRAAKLIDSMADSNIPAGYWFYSMRDFSGPDMLKNVVLDYIKNIQTNFIQGRSICLAGGQGTGKTMSSVCILKKALKKQYTSFYITASDMMAEMTKYSESGAIRRTLRSVDFLVIDELDSRFFPSDAQKELFGGIYENIFRHRAHNLQPTIICTNETVNILDVFSGASKTSINSLNKQYLKIYPFPGVDFRKSMNDV